MPVASSGRASLGSEPPHATTELPKELPPRGSGGSANGVPPETGSAERLLIEQPAVE